MLRRWKSRWCRPHRLPLLSFGLRVWPVCEWTVRVGRSPRQWRLQEEHPRVGAARRRDLVADWPKAFQFPQQVGGRSAMVTHWSHGGFKNHNSLISHHWSVICLLFLLLLWNLWIYGACIPDESEVSWFLFDFPPGGVFVSHTSDWK